MKLNTFVLFTAVGLSGLGASATEKTYARDEFRIRDPFVLTEGDTYYLYESKPWFGGRSVSVRTSKDLERWSEKAEVMKVPEGIRCTAVWAPEVHKYNGKYWLFVTLTEEPDAKRPIRPMLASGFKGGKLQPRGVWIFRSDSPTGPFVPTKDGAVTPAEWMCLDGTLWVEDGEPWMVFCHEWCQTGNGRMMAVRLSKDLSRFASEPIELFRAADHLVGAGVVTDGPFLRSEPGKGLWMIWSNMVKGSGYTVIQCASRSGKIAGPWIKFTPLFKGNGGHGMIFERRDGQLMLTLHQPNGGEQERMKLFPLLFTRTGFSRVDWDPFGVDWQKMWSPAREREIDERIERCRKADASVDLGVPAGTSVKVDQLTSEFLFGSNMFNFDQLGSDAMNAEYRAAFTNLFNAATIPFYWGAFEPVEGQPRFEAGPHDGAAFWNAFDFKTKDPYAYVEWRRPSPAPLIEFCRANNVAMHGHAIIYNAFHPDWVWQKATSPEIAAEVYDRHVSEIAAYYGARVAQWDVVNESLDRTSTKAAPHDEKDWFSRRNPSHVLPKNMTRRAFEVAAKTFPPSVRLSINDAWTIENDAYAAFTRKLINEGAKVDIVGFQKHIFDPRNLLTVASGYPCLTNSQTWDLDDDERRFAEIDALNRPIHLSEITIPSPRGLHGLSDAEADEIQARVMRAYYRHWFSWPSIERITYWNMVDGVGAKNERMSSGWFNRDMSKKRVWYVMNELINQTWRTHLTLAADETGKVAFRGFKGKYALTWKGADGRLNIKEILVK